MKRQMKGLALGFLVVLMLMAGTNVHIAAAVKPVPEPVPDPVPDPGPHPYGPIDPELEEDVSDNESIQNFIEHSWIYSQGTINDMRIYQTAAGYNGQKLVTGTRGTGTVSRTIDAQVYGGNGYNEIWANEWGVFQNRPTRYAAPITKSDLKNALCAKNYEVGSVYSESYSDLVELIKDTTVAETDNESVYSIHSEVEGTAKVGAHVQRSASAVPIYTMTGQYTGYLNMRMSLESGGYDSVLTLPCP